MKKETYQKISEEIMEFSKKKSEEETLERVLFFTKLNIELCEDVVDGTVERWDKKQFEQYKKERGL